MNIIQRRIRMKSDVIARNRIKIMRLATSIIMKYYQDHFIFLLRYKNTAIHFSLISYCKIGIQLIYCLLTWQFSRRNTVWCPMSGRRSCVASVMRTVSTNSTLPTTWRIGGSDHGLPGGKQSMVPDTWTFNSLTCVPLPSFCVLKFIKTIRLAMAKLSDL